VEQGSHPDYFVAEREEGARDFKIAAVRALIARSALRPLRASSKLFVVADAETMNEDAQNALLKTLEEPPPGTVIVLVASAPERLLPTIRSRAQAVTFVSAAEAPAADPELESLHAEALDFSRRLAHGPVPDAVLRAPDSSKWDREKAAAVLEHLIRYYRDVLLLQAGAEALLAGAEAVPAKRRDAQALPPATVAELVDRLAEAKERIVRSVNVRLALAALWQDLAASR
jgi:DNA polymerase-3 subunit delta'